jgi:hypothetical protein
LDQSERDEALRSRLEILRDQFKEGKIHIAEHLASDLKKSIEAVRYGNDGKVDLSTVDSQVRSMALAVSSMKYRSDAKEDASLFDISNLYFEFIEKQFGHFAKISKSKNLDAHQTAVMLSRQPECVSECDRNIPDFLEKIHIFWENLYDPSSYHVQDLQGLKAVYGGDLFPSYTKNIASAVGLYMDTIVLSCPFYHSKHIFENATPEKKTYYLFKHALNVLSYKELATTDLDKPVVVFVPFKSSLDNEEQDFMLKVSQADALKHAACLLGEQFETIEGMHDFCSNLNTLEKVINAIKKPDRLLFDTEWTGSVGEQLARRMEWIKTNFGAKYSHPGMAVAEVCTGRMGQATDILFKSRYLGGTPLIDAPTSWQYFNWKLEYNAVRDPVDLSALHMCKGLQTVSETDEEWLGNIPPNALIEMRKQDAFNEIRNILSDGVREIATTKPDAFFRSSDKIVDNIRDAFQRHKAERKKLIDRGIKFAGYELAPMLIEGGLGVASIITGSVTFGVASLAMNQTIDTPKWKELPSRFREMKSAHTELKKSPMGLFFKHKK